MKVGPKNGFPLSPLKGQTGGIPSGSLIVSDVFNESAPSDPGFHGGAVVAGARSLGFKGPIFFQQVTTTPEPAHAAGLKALEMISSRKLTSQQVVQAARTFAVGAPLHMLASATEETNAASASGAQNSVLNLSSGTSKAQVTQMLYNLSKKAPQAAQNLTQAWGIEPGDFLSQDPQISGRARRKLQQGLVNLVDQAWTDDQRLADEKMSFQKSVADFESNHNSVVIAAGNEGFVQPILEMDGVGDLELPVDFERNILFTHDATVVGASIVLDGEEVEATFTSGDQPISAYASGDRVIGREFDESLGLAGAGTSIAAPRVGAVMAKLHREQPSFTSDEVESNLEGDFLLAPDKMLDHSKAESFLSGPPPDT